MGLETLDRDDKILLKLCLERNLLTETQVQKFLLENSGRQIFYSLYEGSWVDREKLNDLLEIKKKSALCPHCDTIMISQNGVDTAVCRACKKKITPKPFSKDHYGKYKVLGQVGKGSTSVVYKAIHTELQRHAALKVLQIEGREPETLARFKREAKAVAQLDHPNIVSIFDIGEEDNYPFIAMEYVDGKGLKDMMKEPLSLHRKLEIIIQIAKALHHAHARGIIHRDIKPENIMMTKEGQVKIADFGLARHLRESVAITQSHLVMGTPLYMSPEQIQGKELSPSTDLYSLGIVLYELLVGKPPFDHAETEVLFPKIIGEIPPSPSFLNSNIPTALGKICLKAIAKLPQQRFLSGEDLACALEPFLHEHSTSSVKKPATEALSVKKPAIDSVAPAPNVPAKAQPTTGKRLPSEKEKAEIALAAAREEDKKVPWVHTVNPIPNPVLDPAPKMVPPLVPCAASIGATKSSSNQRMSMSSVGNPGLDPDSKVTTMSMKAYWDQKKKNQERRREEDNYLNSILWALVVGMLLYLVYSLCLR